MMPAVVSLASNIVVTYIQDAQQIEFLMYKQRIRNLTALYTVATNLLLP